jgi:hypothetical protein
MTMTLHLGVIDMPYNHDPKGKTTGDVATILEEKYHLMRIFYEYHKPFVAKQLEQGLAGALESVLMGGPMHGNAFGQACDEIADLFKTELAERKFDGRGIPGVPTAASGGTSKRRGGVNHRLKHPYRQSNPVRPSFVDTGLFSESVKCWVD